MDGLFEKHRRLSDLLRDLGSVVVAYSGGVDSAFLMAVAHASLGPGAVAVTAVSPSLARSDLRDATELAQERGWNHLTIGTHEVAREEYARNDSDRCYWCKSELLKVLGPMARERGAEICMGTNTDDLNDHRPGLRAAREVSARTPMVEAELSKADIRSLSKRMGLPTADKPASPCLSSRFAYGVRVTPQGLRRVEDAEAYVREHGFEVLRVRDHGTTARLEVPAEDIPRLEAVSAEVFEHLRSLGYEGVSIDPEGFRSGSLNETLLTPGFRRADA